MKYIILGLALIITGLWGGSYLANVVGVDSGYEFASFFTGLMVVMAGFICVGVGIETIKRGVSNNE